MSINTTRQNGTALFTTNSDIHDISTIILSAVMTTVIIFVIVLGTTRYMTKSNSVVDEFVT